MKRFLILAALLAATFTLSARQWHNPAAEQANGPFERFWTFDAGNIEFSTNSPSIEVRYTLKGTKVPSGAAALAANGVDLFDIDNDGGLHLLDSEYDLVSDTLRFTFSVNYGRDTKAGHVFRLYLPLYNEVKWLEVGVDDGSLFAFEPVPEDKPVLVYSMPVEGVSRPSESVRNVIQRKLDLPVKMVKKSECRKADALACYRGSDLDTVGTVKEIYSLMGLPENLPEILVPVRQRRDIGFYDWTLRHALILHRVRVTHPNPEVAMIGNSITHYWSGEPYNDWHAGVDSWDELYGERNVINLGYGWDRLGNMLWRVIHGEFDGYSAKHIFVMAGTNDINRRPEQKIAEGMVELVRYIRVKQPEAKIHLVHIYPRRNAIDKVDKVNAAVDEILKAEPIDNLDIVDVKGVLTNADGTLDESLFRDGLHPNAEGYRRIASVYKAFLD